MCTLVYLAADVSVPLQAWDDARPTFHVRPLDDLESAMIRRFTSRRHLYYVGTREKCGCPFSYGVNPGLDDSPPELEARAEAISNLQSVLREALTASTVVDLLAFEADEWSVPRPARRLRIAELAHRGFAFAPPEVIEIVGAA